MNDLTGVYKSGSDKFFGSFDFLLLHHDQEVQLGLKLIDFIHLFRVVIFQSLVLTLLQFFELLELLVKLIMPRIENKYLEGESTGAHNQADNR